MGLVIWIQLKGSSAFWQTSKRMLKTGKRRIWRRKNSWARITSNPGLCKTSSFYSPAVRVEEVQIPVPHCTSLINASVEWFICDHGSKGSYTKPVFSSGDFMYLGHRQTERRGRTVLSFQLKLQWKNCLPKFNFIHLCLKITYLFVTGFELLQGWVKPRRPIKYLKLY